jgi:hypothetical protein
MKGRLTVFVTVAVVLVVLVALNAASYVRVEQEGERESRPDRSTVNSGPTGTRALFEYLQQTGHDVVRWNAPPERLGEAEDAPATLVVVGDLRRPVEEGEAAAILGWVAGGGRLVIIDRTPDTRLLPTSDGWRVASEVFAAPEQNTPTEDAALMTRDVGPTRPTQPTPFARDVSEVQPSRFASRLHLHRVEQAPTGYASGPPPRPDSDSESGPGEQDGPAAPGEEEDAPAAPAEDEEAAGEGEAGAADERAGDPPSEGGDGFAEHSAEVPSSPVSHLSDWREGTGALLVDYRYGLGVIVVLSDPYMVSNAGLRLADNLFLAVNVIAGAGGRIAFDEYHQGYGAGRNELLSYFAGTPILWMFGQAGVVALALAWTRGRRFARPLPAPRADRRSKLEFVASMAELQLRARAYDLAVENVYGRTRRALARYGGVRSDAPVEELAARVAARSGRDPARLEALLRECEDAIAGERLSARRAVSLARALRALERDLGLLMRAREVKQAGRA